MIAAWFRHMTDESDTTPEHSHLCMCERCAPANREAVDRLGAELDLWVDTLDARGRGER